MSASRLSDKGAQFIAKFEGFNRDWYLDPAGVRTIGYGHTGPLPAGMRAPITKLEGMRLLELDAANAAECILADVHPPIFWQHRFDALVSFVFNLGCAYVDPHSGHTIAQLLQSRSRKGVADAFLLYDRAAGQRLPGLTARRKAERRLWLYGRYS